MTQAQPATIEIRCKKVFVPSKLTASEISKTYGINQAQQTMKKNAFFVKNYTRKKIIIDLTNKFLPSNLLNIGIARNGGI